ncbi:MAG: hypothetical protein HY000_30355 [Planctomycetes bacterium]|nr:hypothetical protein [Planctomycetota bacterium]
MRRGVIRFFAASVLLAFVPLVAEGQTHRQLIESSTTKDKGFIHVVFPETVRSKEQRVRRDFLIRLPFVGGFMALCSRAVSQEKLNSEAAATQPQPTSLEALRSELDDLRRRWQAARPSRSTLE